VPHKCGSSLYTFLLEQEVDFILRSCIVSKKTLRSLLLTPNTFKMKKLALHWKIIIGLVLGIVWAFISSYAGWSQFTLDWIKPFGDIFMRLLKFIAVPLVVFSIIKGVSSLEVTKLGRIGAKTLSFYLATTITTVALGLLLVNTIQPGNMLNQDAKDELLANIERYETETGRNANLEERAAAAEQIKGGGPLNLLVDMVPENIFGSLANNRLMLQVIFFAIFFAIVLSLISSEKAAPIKSFVDGANEVFIKMILVVMKAAPFFVFALLAGQMADLAQDNPNLLLSILSGLGWYCLTVALGLFILIFLFYPLIIKLFVRRISYLGFFKSIRKAQLMAFSTSSSVATLPVTMECTRENLGVSKDITSFVLPVGATVNMDGTSLYQGVAAVFLAQFYGFDLTLSDQLLIVITATLASIGAPAVPSAGLVMLVIVLESVGMNPLWLALIFPVDRILDMLRTTVNITGDATAATVIAKSENELNYTEKE
jgi:Na+/H+-dicarboxylate symporter